VNIVKIKRKINRRQKLMGLKKLTIIKDPVSYAKFKVRNFAKPAQLTRTWIEDHSPALLRLRRELAITQPFKGLKISICLPGTWEAFMYCSVLEAGGGNLFFYPFKRHSSKKLLTQKIKNHDIVIIFLNLFSRVP